MDFRDHMKSQFEGLSLNYVPPELYLEILAESVHNANEKWWVDLDTGKPKDRNVGELLMLAVSELGEAMNGARQDSYDDHLPRRKMLCVEIVDAMIRLLDTAFVICPDFAAAFTEKMIYNANRADHKVEARKLDGGKKF